MRRTQDVFVSCEDMAAGTVGELETEWAATAALGHRQLRQAPVAGARGDAAEDPVIAVPAVAAGPQAAPGAATAAPEAPPAPGVQPVETEGLAGRRGYTGLRLWYYLPDAALFLGKQRRATT